MYIDRGDNKNSALLLFKKFIQVHFSSLIILQDKYYLIFSKYKVTMWITLQFMQSYHL